MDKITDTTSFPLIDRRNIDDDYLLKRECNPPERLRDEPVLEPATAVNTVLPIDGGWRMYYGYNRYSKISIYDYKVDNTKGIGWLAESNDGVHWEKPSLGRVEVDGTRDNNCFMGPWDKDPEGRLLCARSGPRGFCVLDADRTDVPHARSRYTALYGATLSDEDLSLRGINLAHSEDGIVWHAYPENPLIRCWSDTKNNFFFDRRLGRYVLYMRPFTGAMRTPDGHIRHRRKVMRAESADMVHWTLPETVLDTDEADAPAFDWFLEPQHKVKFEKHGMPLLPRGRTRQFYGMTVHPCGDLYVGLAYLYDTAAAGIWLELTHSFDGILWHREPERLPFLAPRDVGHWDCAMINAPSFAVNGDEIRIYSQGTNRDHHGNILGGGEERQGIVLHAIKRDRWVVYRASEREGALLTRTFKLQGWRLSANAVVASDGEIAFELTDERGTPVQGFERGACKPLTGALDSLDAPLDFEGTSSSPPDQPLRLRFWLRNACLFAWNLA